MRLRSIEIQNYRRYRSVELELPDGLVSIVGANGSGKSTLMEAVAWALFGNQTEIVRTGKESIKRQGASHTEECRVRIEFDFEDAGYIVERTMKGKNHTMNAVMHAGDTQMARGTEEVSEALIKLFGMDHKSFFISVFARQKELNALTSQPKGERKKMVLRLLDIESVDGAIRKIREDRRLADEAIKGAREELADPDGTPADERIRREIAALEALEKEKAAERKKQEAELAIMESVLKKLKTGLSALEKAAKQRDAMISEITATEAKISALADRKEELVRDLEQHSSLEEELKASEPKAAKTRKDLEEVRAKQTDAGNSRGELKSRLGEMAAGIKQLEKEMREARENIAGIESMGPDSDCPTCKRRLGQQFKTLIGMYDSQIAEKGVSADKLMKQREKLESSIAESKSLSDALEKREARLREKLGEFDLLKARVEKGAKLGERLAELEARLCDATAAKSKSEERLECIDFNEEEYLRSREALQELNDQLRSADRSLNELKSEVQLAAERRGNLEKEVARLQQLKSRYDEKKAQAELLGTLDRVMNEFRTHLIARIRPALASMSSEFFGVLTDGRYGEIRLDEDYEISIMDGGEEHGLERFSGGEKDLANLSLRLAISEIIATRHGTDSFDMIVLDEIFGSQDAGRKRTLLATLNGLSNRFKQIFLITHVDDVRELMGNVIQVTDNADGTSSAGVVQ